MTELYTSWLDTPPEEAVIEVRVGADQEATRSEQVNDSVNKILDALRSNGYEPPYASKMSRSTALSDQLSEHGTE